MSGRGPVSPARACVSDGRRSLADQLADVTVAEPKPGRDGVGGLFLDLIEDTMPVVPMDRTIEPVAAACLQLGEETFREALRLTPFVEPASPEDAIAREACAVVDEREYGAQTAAFRRHGCYDGDTEHQIALEAVRLSREPVGD